MQCTISVITYPSPEETIAHFSATKVSFWLNYYFHQYPNHHCHCQLHRFPAHSCRLNRNTLVIPLPMDDKFHKLELLNLTYGPQCYTVNLSWVQMNVIYLVPYASFQNDAFRCHHQRNVPQRSVLCWVYVRVF